MTYFHLKFFPEKIMVFKNIIRISRSFYYFISIILFLLLGCTDKNNIYSTSFYSDSFMNEKLGRSIQSKGEFYYDEDKGCFLNSEIGARIDCSILDKKVIFISAICTDAKKEIKIDGIKCGSQIPFDKQSDYLKLCNETNFDNGYFLQKKNGYLYLDKNDIVKSISLTLDPKYLKEEGEEIYTTEKCTSIPKNRIEENKNKENQIAHQQETRDKLQLIAPYSECTVITMLMAGLRDEMQDKSAAIKLNKFALAWGESTIEMGERIGLNRDDIINLNKSKSDEYGNLIKNNTINKAPLNQYTDLMATKMDTCAELLRSNSELLSVFQSKVNGTSTTTKNNVSIGLDLELQKIEQHTGSFKNCRMLINVKNNSSLNINGALAIGVFREKDGSILDKSSFNISRAKPGSFGDAETNYSGNCTDIKSIEIYIESVKIDGEYTRSISILDVVNNGKKSSLVSGINLK
jgi:hypothetical protein